MKERHSLYFQDHPRESRVRRGPSPVQEGCKIRAHGTFTSRVQSYPAKRRESDTGADSLGHGPLWRVAYRIGGSAADVALAPGSPVTHDAVDRASCILVAWPCVRNTDVGAGLGRRHSFLQNATETLLSAPTACRTAGLPAGP